MFSTCGVSLPSQRRRRNSILSRLYLRSASARPSKHGFVLVVTIAMLGVLGVLAVSFATLARAERDVARNYVDRVRAQMLAQSGIEMALGRLVGWDKEHAWSDPRSGGSSTQSGWYYAEMREKHNGELKPAPSGPRTAVKVNSTKIAAGSAPRDLADLADPPQYVSFHQLGPDGNPLTISMAGAKAFGISGRLPGTYRADGDVFLVKVIDGASMININDNNHNLEFMLNNLGKLLGVSDGTFHLGTHIIQAGKKLGRLFNSKRELKDSFVQALGKEEGEKRFRKVKDFITTVSWIDPTTIWWDKNGKGAGGGSKTPVSGGGYLTKPSQNASPFAWIEPRAPININTASKEVLMATLWGVKASWEEYDTKKAKTATKTAEIGLGESEKIANWIIAHRYDYGLKEAVKFNVPPYTYNDWMHFFQGNDDDVGIDLIDWLSEEDKTLLRVHFNPNSDIKKLNPDLLMVNSNPDVLKGDNRLTKVLRMDKSDIVQGTTEWCWSSMGYYELESIGRVLTESDVVAEDQVMEIVKLFDVVRYSSQRDFEKDRVFEALDGYPLVTEEGYPGVLSLPEYGYNGGNDVTKRYKGKTGDLYLGGDKWAADWDGQLSLNGLVQVDAGQNEPKRSFVSGFGRASVGAEQHRHTNHAHHSPRHPEYGYPTKHCDGKGFTDFAVYSNIQDQKPYQTQNYVSGYAQSTKKAYVLDPGSWGGLWKEGSDLHPFGVYTNYLKRKRVHTYWGDEVPAPEATIEFMVKPEVDAGYWGIDLGEQSLCRRMYLLDWGPASEGAGSAFGTIGTGGYPNYEVRIYTHGPRVYASFYHSKTGSTFIIYKNVNDWYAHTWHHVELTWAAGKDTKKKIAGWRYTCDGAQVEATAPTAMLFVDGKPADGLAGGAQKYDGPCWEKMSLTMKLPENVRYVNPSTNIEASPRVVFGGKYADVGDGTGMSQSHFIGTLDNLILHHWRLHSMQFPPKSRYFDPTYWAEKGYAALVMAGDKNYKCVGGLYLKRVRELEEAAKKEPITLGTVSATHHHQSHTHSGGHQLIDCAGHVNVGVQIRSGGAVRNAVDYDSGLGLPVGWYTDPALRAGDELYVRLEIERRNELPLNHTPTVDDITITYFSSPKVLYRLSKLGP